MATTISIDKAGRIVIPRRLREALGIAGETELEIQQEGESIVLRHKPAGPRMVQERGVWVFESGAGPVTHCTHPPGPASPPGARPG